MDKDMCSVIVGALSEWFPPKAFKGLTEGYLNAYRSVARAKHAHPECAGRCGCPPGKHALYTPEGQLLLPIVMWYHQVFRAIRWLIDKGVDPGLAHACIGGIAARLERFERGCPPAFTATETYHRFLRDGVAHVMLCFAHTYYSAYPTSEIVNVLMMAPARYTDLILIGELHLREGKGVVAGMCFARAIEELGPGPNANIAANYLAAMAAGRATPNEQLHETFPVNCYAGCWDCGAAAGCDNCRLHADSLTMQSLALSA